MSRSSLLVVLAMTLAANVHAGDKYPEFEGLATGRAVWVESCENCHAYGIAGSPKPADKDAWEGRALQGRAVLHTHAIEGFFGPGGTMMPPRGGNDALSDDEVKAAVDYMLRLADVDVKD